MFATIIKNNPATRARPNFAKEQRVRTHRYARGRVLAVVVFALAFTVPIYLVHSSRSALDPVAAYFASLDARSRRIDLNSPRFVFQGTEDLNPPSDKDFLVYSTWKLHTLPGPGERAVLMSKRSAGGLDPGLPQNGLSQEGTHVQSAEGFALGLINDQGAYRFMLSWPSPQGSRWMRFGEVALKADQWFLVAISVRAGATIGGFFVPLTSDAVSKKPKVTVLGGFSNSGFPGRSAAPLSLAPKGAGRFVSRVGPFGVLRSADLAGEEVEILRELARTPTRPPESLKRNQVALFWGGGEFADGTSDTDRFPIRRQM